ncbi:MAG: NB-ARC domain-containing protein, partial [Actinomycetota bacterium]
MTVFLSYSRSDEFDQLVAQKLDVLLRPLSDIGNEIFYDTRNLEVGEDIDPLVDKAMSVTDIAVLLVSPDYLDSKRYARRRELPALLVRHEVGECSLVPIMVRRAPGWKLVDGLHGRLFANDIDAPLQEDLDQLDGALGRIAELIIDRAIARSSDEPVVEPGPSDYRSDPAVDAPAVAVHLEPSAEPGPLVGVPSLPAELFDRPEAIAAVREALTDDAVAGISGARGASAFGLAGQGGIGKTTVAVAVANDRDVRRLFPDGVIWLTVGEHRNMLEAQVSLLRLLGDPGDVRTITEARERLESRLTDGRRLVVLDDVWTAQQFEQLALTGGRSRTLVTTRHRSLVLDPAGAAVHELGELTGRDAEDFLAQATGPAFSSLDVDVDAIVQATGGVALALALVGGALRHGVEPETVVAKLQTDTFGNHPYANQFRALTLAADSLDEELWRSYLSLAVFPSDTDIPTSIVERWWAYHFELAPSEVGRRLTDLASRNLLEVDGEHLRFHDLQHDYIRFANVAVASALHSDFIEATRPDSGNWHDLNPADSYLWEHVADHLIQADVPVHPVVVEPAWVVRRIAWFGIAALERDLQAAIDQGLPGSSAAELLLGSLGGVAHLIPGRGVAEVARSCRLQLPELPSGRSWADVLPGLSATRAAPKQLGGNSLRRVLEGHAGGVLSVGWSPDGTRLASASDDGTLRVWDPATGDTTIILEGHTDWVRSVGWSPDGTRLASASDDGTVRVWDPVTGDSTRVLEGPTDWVQSVGWSPDGTRLATASTDQTVRVWDPATGDTTIILEGHTDWVRSVGWSPDGTRLATAGYDNTVRVLDPATGDSTRVLEGHTGGVLSVGWSPDGTRLASASYDNTVRVWDPDTGHLTVVLEGHTDWVRSVGWSPDGTRLASGSGDGTVRVWDPATGDTGMDLESHTDWVVSVGWSPDGTRLASGSGDGTVRVWDPDTGHLTVVLEGHTDWVRSVGWSPDGTR